LNTPDGKFKKGRRASPATEFKKGIIPWNTGRKGVHYSPATEFKKGHVPASMKYDGCISVRVKRTTGEKYKFIRISKNKWVQYHRYIWEKHYGKIPEGMIVRFKNGNSLDVRIENLEMISKNENLIRNRNYNTDKMIAGYITRDPELKKLVVLNPHLLEIKRLQLKLGRSLNGRKIKSVS